MADTNTFGAFLRSMRKQLDVTQEIAAKKAGISGSYLAQLESGTRNPPSADIVRRIAHAYVIDTNLMLSEAGYGENPKTQIAPERVEWAFNAMCTDPDFHYGHAIRHKPFDMDTKAFLVEMYSHCTGRMLLTEGVIEAARVETDTGAHPLEAYLNAVAEHLKPQLRKIIRERPLEVPFSDANADVAPVEAALTQPATQGSKAPVRKINMDRGKATATAPTTVSTPKASVPAKRKKKDG